jgi:predicted RNA-binding protein with RPS1 domain
VGEVISGKVTNVTGFGLFVELEDGIEGLVHISQVVKRPEEDIKDRYKVGDAVTAKILRIDPVEQKIGLSITEHLDDIERKETRVERPEPAVINPVLSEDINLDHLKTAPESEKESPGETVPESDGNAGEGSEDKG